VPFTLFQRLAILDNKYKFFTFPQIFGHFYDGRLPLAGIIDWICRFTSSQVLAGAKLASATDGLVDTNCTDRHGDYCGSLYTIGVESRHIHTIHH
jgi:hypothetical protein